MVEHNPRFWRTFMWCVLLVSRFNVCPFTAVPSLFWSGFATSVFHRSLVFGYCLFPRVRTSFMVRLCNIQCAAIWFGEIIFYLSLNLCQWYLCYLKWRDKQKLDTECVLTTCVFQAAHHRQGQQNEKKTTVVNLVSCFTGVIQIRKCSS